MKKNVIWILGSFAVIGMSPILAMAKKPDAAVAKPLNAALIASGKDIYEGTCIACHGSNGKGDIPGTPNFTKSDGVLKKGDDELITNITYGFESPGSDMPMPAKGGNEELTDEEIKAVLAYIRHEFEKVD